MTDFDALPGLTQSRLAELSSLVSGVVPVATKTWTLTTDSPSYLDDAHRVVDEATSWAGDAKAFIYVFRLAPPHPDSGEIAKLFAHAKKAKNGGRAYARLNKGYSSGCMYVGSSRTLPRRLGEHFGLGARGTYALQLQHWALHLNLNLQIECAKYPDELPPGVLQSLEDTLWSEERPMFGRRGAK